MKVSEVTVEDVKQSIGYTAKDCDGLIGAYLAAGRAYIRGCTKLPDYTIDEHEDLTVVLLCIVGDFFENRSMTVAEESVNPTVKTILSLYAENHI